MNNSSSSNINITSERPKPILKKPWQIGSNILVVIDNVFVEHLGINEDNTLLQEELVGDGILLRIIKI